MGVSIISKQEEELYVLNNITKGDENGLGATKLTPDKVVITTSSYTYERNEVVAALSKAGATFGDIYLYYLQREDGKIASHEYLGTAGFHVLPDNILKEYKPDAPGNVPADKLPVSKGLIEKAILEHAIKVKALYASKDQGMGR